MTDTVPDDTPAAGLSSTARLTRIALVLVVLVALVLLGRQLSAQLPRLTAAVDGLGAWGPVVFIAAYALASVAFVPASLLTLAAGALFGVVKGTIFVLHRRHAWFIRLVSDRAIRGARLGLRARAEGPAVRRHRSRDCRTWATCGVPAAACRQSFRSTC